MRSTPAPVLPSPARRRPMLAAALATITLSIPAAMAADPPKVPYPDGYRNWTHVKTLQILPGHALYDAFGGIHHLYANAKAMEGYKKGRFPDGSVIVFDLLEAKEADKTIGTGARKVVGVMHKDAKRWAATGGWGYEGFKGDSKTERAVGANAASACHACHTAQKDKDYVFSAWQP